MRPERLPSESFFGDRFVFIFVLAVVLVAIFCFGMLYLAMLLFCYGTSVWCSSLGWWWVMVWMWPAPFTWELTADKDFSSDFSAPSSHLTEESGGWGPTSHTRYHTEEKMIDRAFKTTAPARKLAVIRFNINSSWPLSSVSGICHSIGLRSIPYLQHKTQSSFALPPVQKILFLYPNKKDSERARMQVAGMAGCFIFHTSTSLDGIRREPSSALHR
jgi:hypothetical protein